MKFHSTIVLIACFAFTSGCKKTAVKKSPPNVPVKASTTTNPASESEAPTVEENTAESESADQVASGKVGTINKKMLARVFHQVWCLNQRQDRDGLDDVLNKAGFKDAAAWSAAWARATEEDPQWVEKVMGEVVIKPCLVPKNPAGN